MPVHSCRTKPPSPTAWPPVTNWPQTNLNALAGLYVGDSGYNQVIAETGTLTFIKDAYSPEPTIASNLVPRANGWFSRTNSQGVQFAFTNLSEHDMVVLHQTNGAFETVAALGEHYVPAPLSAAWSIRTNRVYRIVDMFPSDYFWEPSMPQPKTLHFWVKDGELLTYWMFGAFVEKPQSDNLAYQYGVQYRKGGAIQVTTTNGFELLQYSSFRFLDEAAIPTLPVPAITNGTIPFANGTQWYWFNGRNGTTYRARLTALNQDYFVRITDREGITCSAGINVPATWTCTSNGTYAMAVSATNSFAFGLSLTVCGCRQTQNDYDGDGKADPAVYDPTANQLLVRFSTQSYILETTPMGTAGCIPVIGDFDGDNKADPALYSATSGLLTVWLSGSQYAEANVPLGGAGWSNASEDYDGDGRTDPTVYEASSGTWQVLFSGNGYTPLSSLVTAGGAGFVPVAGDYDGDGKADLMLYQSAEGLWLCAWSSQGYAITGMTGFGGPTMVARAGDYDNDGLSDPAVYDPVTRTFYVLFSGSNYRPGSLSW